MKIRLYGLCLLIMMLAACSGTSYIHKAENVESWKQTLKQLEQVNQWNIQGKISIRSGEELYTADLYWQQKQQALNLRLVAPFSQGVTQFTGNDKNGYQVLTDKGQLFDVDSPESVTEHAFGVSMPFSELKSWVKGIPDSETPVWRARFNADNRLQEFEQSGWKIKILKYRKMGNQVLPVKLFLSRLSDDMTDNKVDVRLILRRWVL